MIDFSSGLFGGFIDGNGRHPDDSTSAPVWASTAAIARSIRTRISSSSSATPSKFVGNHTFKFGVDVRRAYNLRVPSDVHRSGELTFNNGRTASP